MVEIGGYPFENPKLLEQALTTQDYSKQEKDKGNKVPCQMPMRTLGDRVLSLILAEYYYPLYATQKEINDAMEMIECSKGECILAEFLKFQIVNKSNNDKNLDSEDFLSETTEAIIAAVFLDSDYYTCKDVVLGWLRETKQIPALE
ncbi:MAG: hypothetical protein KKH41_03370 [Candidatus Thermoplasmatota archaeon]|nr:hypothetical protein [Euryarchaeota archaeon]MBU4031879.1 hypothetical protein [Candidatus Thermoplasmatota archaeon]MBU4071054.1 hypothetical protein [Candidatus Thermoplasmatota archaeon]MBU4143821.1 hypothetical protein [Candidatus Thermoplasmatota archaeon]MBU4591606.1 hypothetical protein [Candidatus Thermoplasmatota archaeon]